RGIEERLKKAGTEVGSLVPSAARFAPCYCGDVDSSTSLSWRRGGANVVRALWLCQPRRHELLWSLRDSTTQALSRLRVHKSDGTRVLGQVWLTPLCTTVLPRGYPRRTSAHAPGTPDCAECTCTRSRPYTCGRTPAAHGAVL